MAVVHQSHGPSRQLNHMQVLINPIFSLPNQSMAVRNRWQGKNKVSDHRRSGRGGVGYKPPSSLQELEPQSWLKARRRFSRKKRNARSMPYAPRNTTSYIIRAKKAGGIASLVSPCPVTPAVLQTPVLTPSREIIGDTAKEEWGVDGYGTMNGLIRLRDEKEEEKGGRGGSSESEVEEEHEHAEMERRLDHDVSRFVMIYPNNYNPTNNNNALENRAEEDNSRLKEKLLWMGREMEDLKRRLLRLERRKRVKNNQEELKMDYDR